MKLFAFLVISLFANLPARAANGFRCVTVDSTDSYLVSARFLDWAKIGSERSCARSSVNSADCRFNGCEKIQISAQLARKSDGGRLAMKRNTRAQAPARLSPGPSQRSISAMDDAIDEIKRQNAIREQNAQLQHIADELEYERTHRR